MRDAMSFPSFVPSGLCFHPTRKDNADRPSYTPILVSSDGDDDDDMPITVLSNDQSNSGDSEADAPDAPQSPNTSTDSGPDVRVGQKPPSARKIITNRSTRKMINKFPASYSKPTFVKWMKTLKNELQRSFQDMREHAPEPADAYTALKQTRHVSELLVVSDPTIHFGEIELDYIESWKYEPEIIDSDAITSNGYFYPQYTVERTTSIVPDDCLQRAAALSTSTKPIDSVNSGYIGTNVIVIFTVTNTVYGNTKHEDNDAEYKNADVMTRVFERTHTYITYVGVLDQWKTEPRFLQFEQRLWDVNTPPRWFNQLRWLFKYGRNLIYDKLVYRVSLDTAFKIAKHEVETGDLHLNTLDGDEFVFPEHGQLLSFSDMEYIRAYVHQRESLSANTVPDKSFTHAIQPYQHILVEFIQSQNKSNSRRLFMLCSVADFMRMSAEHFKLPPDSIPPNSIPLDTDQKYSIHPQQVLNAQEKLENLTADFAEGFVVPGFYKQSFDYMYTQYAKDVQDLMEDFYDEQNELTFKCHVYQKQLDKHLYNISTDTLWNELREYYLDAWQDLQNMTIFIQYLSEQFLTVPDVYKYEDDPIAKQCALDLDNLDEPNTQNRLNVVLSYNPKSPSFKKIRAQIITYYMATDEKGIGQLIKTKDKLRDLFPVDIHFDQPDFTKPQKSEPEPELPPKPTPPPKPASLQPTDKPKRRADLEHLGGLEHLGDIRQDITYHRLQLKPNGLYTRPAADPPFQEQIIHNFEGIKKQTLWLEGNSVPGKNSKAHLSNRDEDDDDLDESYTDPQNAFEQFLPLPKYKPQKQGKKKQPSANP